MAEDIANNDLGIGIIYGSGLYLPLTNTYQIVADGGGLNLIIRAHKSLIGRVVSTTADDTILLPENATRWIWEMQNNSDALQSYGVTEGSESPGTPENPAHLLAIVTTSGGLITSIVAKYNTVYTATNLLKGYLRLISLADYGAVGDDTTDNYEAIQAALDDAERYDYSILYIPSGIFRYRLNPGRQALKINKGILIAGAGKKRSILRCEPETPLLGPVSVPTLQTGGCLKINQRYNVYITFVVNGIEQFPNQGVGGPAPVSGQQTYLVDRSNLATPAGATGWNVYMAPITNADYSGNTQERGKKQNASVIPMAVTNHPVSAYVKCLGDMPFPMVGISIKPNGGEVKFKDWSLYGPSSANVDPYPDKPYTDAKFSYVIETNGIKFDTETYHSRWIIEDWDLGGSFKDALNSIATGLSDGHVEWYMTRFDLRFRLSGLTFYTQNEAFDNKLHLTDGAINSDIVTKVNSHNMYIHPIVNVLMDNIRMECSSQHSLQFSSAGAITHPSKYSVIRNCYFGAEAGPIVTNVHGHTLLLGNRLQGARPAFHIYKSATLIGNYCEGEGQPLLTTVTSRDPVNVISQGNHYINGTVNTAIEESSNWFFDRDYFSLKDTGHSKSVVQLIADVLDSPTITALRTGGSLADGTYEISTMHGDRFTRVIEVTITGGGGNGSITVDKTPVDQEFTPESVPDWDVFAAEKGASARQKQNDAPISAGTNVYCITTVSTTANPEPLRSLIEMNDCVIEGDLTDYPEAGLRIGPTNGQITVRRTHIRGRFKTGSVFLSHAVTGVRETPIFEEMDFTRCFVSDDVTADTVTDNRAFHINQSAVRLGRPICRRIRYGRTIPWLNDNDVTTLTGYSELLNDANPESVTATGDLSLPLDFSLHRLNGATQINNIYLGNTSAKCMHALRGARIGLRFQGTSAISSTGNIRPLFTGPRIADSVYWFVWEVDDNGNAFWTEQGGDVSPVISFADGDVSIANNTTEISLIKPNNTNTIPAVMLTQYRQIELELSGYYSVAEPLPTITFRIKLGETTVGTLTVNFGKKVSDAFWQLKAILSIKTTGVTGSVNLVAKADLDIGEGGFTSYGVTTKLNPTLNTNTDKIIDITGQMSVADAGNIMVSTQYLARYKT
jgi:hypothetical protein